MRITSIELAGSVEKGKRLPRAFAKVSRTADDQYIEVTILRPNCPDRKHMVQADCEEDIRSMASCLHHTLAGYDGTNSEIEEYVRVLQYLAD